MPDKIIIADYSILMRNAIGFTLKGKFPGLDITQSKDGCNLVASIKQERYALAITANDLGNMSGIQAITEIRTFNREIPIYFCTGLYSPELANSAVLAGATGVLDKTSNNFAKDLIGIVGNHIAQY